MSDDAYAEAPERFGKILDDEGKALDDYGRICAIYFREIADELGFSNFAKDNGNACTR